MNGLSLRIASGFKNQANTMSAAPVSLNNFEGRRDELMTSFISASTTEQQLAILKRIVAQNLQGDENIINFLVCIFFYSEVKHPIKCFLTRFIINNEDLHQPFIELLVTEIKANLKKYLYTTDYYAFINECKEVVSRVAICIENFPQGVVAVKTLELPLSQYLMLCLYKCVHIIKNQYSRNFTASAKNELYGAIHLSLRLLHHLITKAVPEIAEPTLADGELIMRITFEKGILIDILKDNDMPMDTKCICGVVLLSLDIYRNNVPEILELYDKWQDDHVRLALFSAVLTKIPLTKLTDREGNPLIMCVLKHLMDIVERGSGDGVLILGVARALHQTRNRLGLLEPTTGRAASTALLTFALAHLDHFMDSVRHLAHQTLAAVMTYYAVKDEIGGGSMVEEVLKDLGSRGCSRGLLAGAEGAARACGAARLLRALPLAALLPAVRHAHLAAQATVTLNNLLKLHCKEGNTEDIYSSWVLPIIAFIRSSSLDCEPLAVLESLLAQALTLLPTLLQLILPHVEEACASSCDLRHVLTLGCAVRTSRGNAVKEYPDDMWLGIIPYSLLAEAIVDANDEVRIQCLSLISGGTGATVTAAECSLALRYARYCSSAQAPHTRQRALTHLNKFLKRVVDGHRLALRSGNKVKADAFRLFVAELMELCADFLRRGANYSRRTTALQLLQAIQLSPLSSAWQPPHVERLLWCLDDSYEANKKLALEILLEVPVEMLRDEQYSSSLELDHICRQANALKPTECVSAAYKLELLCKKLPEKILLGVECAAPLAAEYTALQALLRHLRPRHRCDLLSAPRDAPAYGLLYCARHLLDRLSEVGRLGGAGGPWGALAERVEAAARELVQGARPVLDCVSPEGVMPATAVYSDYGNNAGVLLEDGRQVTAQMVLLCAWRSMKEGTGVLAALASVPGLLRPHQVTELAEFLAHVLASARHRGAFEQAYVAYHRVLHRMWRDPERLISHWPEQQLALTLRWLAGGGAWTPDAAGGGAWTPDSAGGGVWKPDATRRSAGLPFLIQALVSTQQGTAGQGGSALRAVMEALLHAARTAPEPVARAHCANVLRALYRDSSLHKSVQGYVGEGLCLAIRGFEGATWDERNSSTLLLSALVQRVFGVSRARAALTARDRMTGRVFFLRYPQLYDIMLEKLREVSEGGEKLLLSPSLYPVLLLLGRLYPSSLEGTESNIKLVSFVPHVVSCARSRVLLARRLAASAAAGLIAPDRYVGHLCSMFGLIASPAVERNFCHGILLQICALLDSRPENVEVPSSDLAPVLNPTKWILVQPPERTCYPLLQQYVGTISRLLDNFSGTLDEEMLKYLEEHLSVILLSIPSGVAPGQAVCLQDCLSLALTLKERKGQHESVADLVVTGLEHPTHEVNSTALEYVLRLHGRPTSDDQKARNMSCEFVRAALGALRARDYLSRVRRAVRLPALWSRDPQRATRLQQVLVMEEAYDDILATIGPPWLPRRPPLPGPAGRVCGLARLVAQLDDPRLALEALTRLLSRLLRENKNYRETMHALHEGLNAVMMGCAPSVELESRSIAARFLRDNFHLLQNAATLTDEDSCLQYRIEMKPLVALSWLLRDEEASLRSLAAEALQPEGSRSVVEEVAMEWLRARCDRQRLATLALSPPPYDRPYNAVAEKLRVFDESEKYNLYSEEELWERACALDFVRACAAGGVRPGGGDQTAGGVHPEGGVDPSAELDRLLEDNKTPCNILEWRVDPVVLARFRSHF